MGQCPGLPRPSHQASVDVAGPRAPCHFLEKPVDPFALSLWVVPSALQGALLLRAKVGNSLSQFPLLYSYVGFLFLSSAVLFPVFFLRPQDYASAYWFRFTIMLLAEFAVLIEVSDHVFLPYPAIRLLGWFLATSIGGALLLLYVWPSLLQHRPSSLVFLDFAKRVSLTKAVLVVVLMAGARHYRLPLEKSVRGILIGFSLQLTVSIANFAVAAEFGKAIYGSFLAFLFPVSHSLCLLVWLTALWRYEHALPVGGGTPGVGQEENLGALGIRLGRLRTVLTKMLRK